MKSINRKLTMYKTRARVSIRDFGIFHTLSRGVLDVILGRIFLLRKYIIYEKQLPREAASEIRNPTIKFSFLTPADTDLIVQIEELSAISREMTAFKLRHGGCCIIAQNEGKLVGFNLVGTGQQVIRYLNVKLNLNNTEAWSEQITVSIDYRRGGLASDLRHMMFAHLSNQGYTKLIGGYVPFNKKSGALARKLGFVETEKITMLRIFGWKKLYRHSLLPGKELSLSLDIHNK